VVLAVVFVLAENARLLIVAMLLLRASKTLCHPHKCAASLFRQTVLPPLPPIYVTPMSAMTTHNLRLPDNVL
jgi:hypothetical protein